MLAETSKTKESATPCSFVGVSDAAQVSPAVELPALVRVSPPMSTLPAAWLLGLPPGPLLAPPVLVPVLPLPLPSEGDPVLVGSMLSIVLYLSPSEDEQPKLVTTLASSARLAPVSRLFISERILLPPSGRGCQTTTCVRTQMSIAGSETPVHFETLPFGHQPLVSCGAQGRVRRLS